MQPSSHAAKGAGTDARQTLPVVGRIDATETDLGAAIESWLGALRARRRKPRTIEAFRQVVDRAVRDLGWTSIRDVTYEAVTAWLGAHDGWSRATYNRNLSVFRSLTRHATMTKRLEDDPLLGAPRAVGDGGDGARAATTDEARALILHAWVRDQADRRCKGSRALYWLCLFAAGCRVGEPALWRRRDLALEHEHPHVLWRPEVQKTSKRQVVCIAPELADLLRAHLRRQDQDRATDGLPPAGPDDPVFPVVPSRTTFRADRDGAGIAAIDYRSRGFSPHSARKWYSTTLTAAGVPALMVDFLMRHSGRVEHRYYDPSLAEQAEALSRLPRLWPDLPGPGGNAPDESGPNVHNSGILGDDLTTGPESADHGSCCSPGPSRDPPAYRSRSPALPRACRTAHSACTVGPGLSIEQVLRAAGQGRRDEIDEVESTPGMRPVIGISGP